MRRKDFDTPAHRAGGSNRNGSKASVRATLALGAACLTFAATAFAADRADLEGTQITGSRELPKVLYIVPWKQPLPTDLVGRPGQSLLDEALAPIDREVFQREVQYHALLQQIPTPPPKPSAAVGGAKPGVAKK